MKTRSALAAGSYHVNTDGSEITGVSFPVKVDPAILKDKKLKEVTDKDSYDITVTLRGKATTTTYKGVDALFENAGSYAYYQLSAAPAYYKELTLDEDGDLVFSEIKADNGLTALTTNSTKDAKIKSGSEAHHDDYELTISGYNPTKVYGGLLHTGDGKSYPLRHLENIWRGGEFGFNIGHKNPDKADPAYSDIEGKTLTGVTVYTDKGIDNVTFSAGLFVAPEAKDKVTAASRNGQDIEIKGLPKDIRNPKADLTYSQPVSGQTRPQTVYVIKDVDVADGTISLTRLLNTAGVVLQERAYTVTVRSDNYATISARFSYPNPFEDVSKNDYYYNAVVWAYQNGVTSGTGDTTFSPQDPTTRAQFVQLLYAQAGKPPVTGTIPFTDVKTTDYYYNAVLWAYQNKITAGTSDTTFGPDDNCSRGQMAQLLYKYTKAEKVDAANTFTDVTDKDYYYDAVIWAYQNKITSGTGDGTTFSPKTDCIRGDMVMFLYKLSQVK